MQHWEVGKEESGLKLADFLKQKLGPSISQKQIKRAIDQSKCSINGRPERFASVLVGYGDKIVFEAAVEPAGEGSILFEDADMLVYNKPSQMTVETLEKKVKWRLVHRLDRDTTGALIFAKRDAIFEALVLQFKKKAVQKSYLALVDGVPKKDEGRVENYLGKLKMWQGQSLWGAVVPEQGQHALTHWKCLRKGAQCALMECTPITGRTHQIRAHLASIGHPILGDKQYGPAKLCKYPAPRPLLHAASLRFEHPVTHVQIVVEAPLPPDFNAAVETLWKGQRP